jgi:hypothetical protein
VKFGRKPKLTRQEIDHARKLIDAGERREDARGYAPERGPDHAVSGIGGVQKGLR